MDPNVVGASLHGKVGKNWDLSKEIVKFRGGSYFLRDHLQEHLVNESSI